MFTTVFIHEFKYWVKKPSTYLYFLAFFSIALLLFVGTAGLFDPHITGSKTQKWVNSPHEINYVVQYFNKFFLFLLPAIIGATIYKDFKFNVHTVVYSFPIRKADYLLGKFLSSLLVTLLIGTSFSLGMLVGELAPGLDPSKMGSINILGYLQAYFVYTAPNLLVYGSIVFTVVALFRNIYAGFVIVILLLCLQTISENAFSSGLMIALSDPFGQNTAKYLTHLWTLQEQNTLVIPVSEVVIYNRLIWLGLAGISFLVLFRKFNFEQDAAPSFFSKLKRNHKAQREILSSDNQKVALPLVNYSYSFKQQLSICWKQAVMHFKYIITSWMFLLISLLGILSIVFLLAKITNNGEITLLPVTQLMLAVPAFFFIGIILLVTFIYSGMLVHRERLSRMDQLMDTTAIPNWVFLTGKLLAIIKVQAVLLLLMMISGIVLQAYNGYYDFEIGLYLFHLFVPTFLALIIWACTSILIHTLLPNVYMGIFVLVIGWIGTGGLSQVGIRSKLLLFNPPPNLEYTDLNGYGNELIPYLYTELYWAVFGGMLLIAAYLLWNRGLSSSFKDRLSLVKTRLTKQVAITLIILIVSFTFLGFDIHQKQQLDADTTDKAMNTSFAKFKKEYSRYEGTIQPKITSVKMEVALYPESNSFIATGEYVLINKSIKVIDTLLVKTGFDEISSFSFDRDSELVSEDPNMKFSVVKLAKPLAPGSSLKMNFEIKNQPNSFYGRNSSVLDNGTFIMADICPRLGYDFSEDSEAHPSDSIAIFNNVLGADADIIDFEATVSTSHDQTAIAAGYLVKKWETEGRNYFHYKMDQPIKFVFGFNSGRFDVKKVEENGVSLEVYHHATHGQNVDKMLDGLKASLAYNSKNFGPYQHREARIIEFPSSEGSYATTFANSIPISEIRFIADAREGAEKADLPFYVAAHELTHQWWGAQVIPADARGSRMLSESITEYITLNIYKDYYGKEKALNFLKLQRSRYLKGRTSEQEEEPPLFLVKPEQQYIAYGKGATVFNSLAQYIGTEELNRILREFLEEFQFKTSPYPTSLNLVALLKKEVPDSLSYLIEDMFATVTFYDNSVVKAESKEIEDDEFLITVSLDIQKKRTADDENLPLKDYVEVGMYDANGNEIYLQKHKIMESNTSLEVRLDVAPAEVVIDPNLLLIDMDLADNTMEFSTKN